MNYRYSDDETLWNDFRSGSKEAYEYLFRAYSSVLYNYGYKISQDAMITKDALQEVFLTLLTKYHKINFTTSIKLYLLKSLRVEINRRIKADHRFKDNLIQDVDFGYDLPLEDRIIEDEITMIRVRQLSEVIKELPRRQKESIYLKYYEGLSYQEISEVMEIDVTSAYKMIYKGLEHLYEKLAVKNGKMFY